MGCRRLSDEGAAYASEAFGSLLHIGSAENHTDWGQDRDIQNGAELVRNLLLFGKQERDAAVA